jgi:Carboxypeptidase regulatory-like domain
MPAMNRSHIFQQSSCRSLLVLIALFASFAAAAASAQTQAPPNTQAVFIKGTVKDASGALVQEATVTLEEKTRSESVEGKTPADGTFSFLALKDGMYVVRAKKPGFREAVSEPMKLALGDKKQIDLVLKPQKERAAQK